MKIYEVRSNVVEYQWLIARDADVFFHFTYDLCSEPWGSMWSPMEFYVYDPKRKKGHFSYAGPNVLAFEPEVLEVMQDLFERSGEILDIRCDGRDMKLLNLTRSVDCLDPEKTSWKQTESGERGSIREYSFVKDRLPSAPLFKIPETCRGEILTCAGLHLEDEFIARYEAHRLTGLRFLELWSDEIDTESSVS